MILVVLIVITMFAVAAAFIAYFAYKAIRFFRIHSLPVYSMKGYLSVGGVDYATGHFNSYSVDSEGKTYTHIGAGEEYHVPTGYTLSLYPGDKRSWITSVPITLRSMPGRYSILKIPFGYGTVYYCEDKDGSKYYVSNTLDV